MYLHRGWGQRHEFCFLTYGVTIYSPSTLHSQSRTLPRAFSPLWAKIAHLVEVPVSQSDLENSISRLRASTTRLIEFSKFAVNSNKIFKKN